MKTKEQPAKASTIKVTPKLGTVPVKRSKAAIKEAKAREPVKKEPSRKRVKVTPEQQKAHVEQAKEILQDKSPADEHFDKETLHEEMRLSADAAELSASDLAARLDNEDRKDAKKESQKRMTQEELNKRAEERRQKALEIITAKRNRRRDYRASYIAQKGEAAWALKKRLARQRYYANKAGRNPGPVGQHQQADHGNQERKPRVGRALTWEEKQAGHRNGQGPYRPVGMM